MVTKQGLESSLYAILEVGYKAHERGINIEAARAEVKEAVDFFVAGSGLKSEVLRIMSRRGERSTS